MSYRHVESDSLVTLEPAANAAGAVVWLHGLGADGHDFVAAVEALRLPASLPIRFLFPHADPRPVTINQGYIMRAWYDIRTLSGMNEDESGIRASERVIRRLLQQQLDAGLSARQIVLAGFSQGGAMALHTALRYEQSLAGVLALSTYLPLASKLADEAHPANRQTPIFLCHGTHDAVVPLRAGEQSRDLLSALGFDLEWHTYSMGHEVTLEQLTQIGRWLITRLMK